MTPTKGVIAFLGPVLSKNEQTNELHVFCQVRYPGKQYVSSGLSQIGDLILVRATEVPRFCTSTHD